MRWPAGPWGAALGAGSSARRAASSALCRASGPRSTPAAWVVAAVFALVMGHGFLHCLGCVGRGDWDYFVTQSFVARRSILEFGEAPLWNPYACGGMPLLGNFQSRVLSPSFALVLALGPIAGNRLWALVLLALGFEGGRRLAWALGAGPWGGYFCALASAGNGGVLLHLGAGQLGVATIALVPWLLLSFRRCLDDPARGVLHGGLWGALLFVEAGLYPLLFGGLLVGAWALQTSLAARSPRPLLAALALGAAIPLLSASTFLPAVAFLIEHGRTSVAPESIPLGALYDVFLSLDQAIDGRARFAGQRWWWHEYGVWVGPLFLPLVVAGALAARRRALGWLLLGGFFLVLGMGGTSRLSPWALLHHLPVFRSLRDSGRALGPAVVCFAVAGARGLDRLAQLGQLEQHSQLGQLGRLGRVVPWAVAAFGLSLAATMSRLPATAFDAPSDLTVSDAPFTQRYDPRHVQTMTREHTTTMALDVAANRGNLLCYDPVSPRVAAQPHAPDRAEAELVSATGAVHPARTLAWSPNSVRVEVGALALAGAEPALLVLNQNSAPGWVLADGRPLVPFHRLLATAVAPEDREVTFVYAPFDVYLGVLVHLLALLAVVRLLALLRLRRACPRAPEVT